MKVVCCKNCGAKYQLDDDDDISAFECSPCLRISVQRTILQEGLVDYVENV